MTESTRSTPDRPDSEVPFVENELRASRERRPKPATFSPLASPEPQATTTPASAVRQPPMPYEVKQRFVQVGKIYYFRDGAKAFEDHGRRLTTPSENTEVVATLVAIAEARGWKRLVVSGSESFRKEVWRQAARRELSVHGYQPTEVERAKLAQELSADRAPSANEPRAAKPRVLPAKAAAQEEPLEPAPEAAPAARPRANDAEPLRGKLLAVGAARYRNDAEQSPSYFVKLATDSGERTIWGRDLERALTVALSKPQIGDDILLRRERREAVSVRFADKRPDGSVVDREEVRFRNRWSIETTAWLGERAQLADALRHPKDKSLPASPELVNARLAVRQAELMAEQRISDVRQRRGFVDAVREQVAERLARGQPVPAPALRPRSVEIAPRERGEPAL